MALIFNQETISLAAAGKGAWRQALLNDQRVKNIDFSVERITLNAGAGFDLTVAGASLAWFEILEGEAELIYGAEHHKVGASHVVFLPPSFSGRIESAVGAVFLFAEVPDAKRFDPKFEQSGLKLKIIDWSREPVLLSEYDARKRIYLVTPKLFGTRAIKGEMIIYPPNTEAAKHHHEGAAHFMYVLSGSGTVFASDVPSSVRKGDIIYYPDRETHYLRSDQEAEMRFVEFFIPGECKTVWAEGASVCTWSPSGADINGNKAAREIQAHSSAKPTSDI